MNLETAARQKDYQALLQELTQTWHQTIPLSEFMQVAPKEFDGNELQVSAPLAPNINLHQTMFAGSIYTLMTLTGWGMIWLQQKLIRNERSIVLANAKVRYLAPIESEPVAKVKWQESQKALLAQEGKVKVALDVFLFCDGKICAEFKASYVCLD